ncbi:hypothetical protein [Saccharopolyspora shandongensis]|uniref:hypothetical protein n=1 Tax=Saccharopolyspora shandongensis TaxID=418495 RepID=UPI0033D8966E
MLALVDHGELDQALSGWTARDGQRAKAVALDGKTMRAAVTGKASMPQTQVVAAMNSRGEVLGQTAVEAGDENAAARDLLPRLGRKALEKVVITADAKHTGATFVSEVEKVGAF